MEAKSIIIIIINFSICYIIVNDTQGNVEERFSLFVFVFFLFCFFFFLFIYFFYFYFFLQTVSLVVDDEVLQSDPPFSFDFRFWGCRVTSEEGRKNEWKSELTHRAQFTVNNI